VPHDGDPATNTALVTEDGSAFDPDGDPLVYTWADLAHTVYGTTPILTTALTPGSYEINLTATDPYGASSMSAFVIVEVHPEPNSGPQAVAGSDQSCPSYLEIPPHRLH